MKRPDWMKEELRNKLIDRMLLDLYNENLIIPANLQDIYNYIKKLEKYYEN